MLGVGVRERAAPYAIVNPALAGIWYRRLAAPRRSSVRSPLAQAWRMQGKSLRASSAAHAPWPN